MSRHKHQPAHHATAIHQRKVKSEGERKSGRIEKGGSPAGTLVPSCRSFLAVPSADTLSDPLLFLGQNQICSSSSTSSNLLRIAEYSTAELKKTERLFVNLSHCVDRSSESPTVVTSAIFCEDLFSMDRIVQLCSSRHVGPAKSLLECFVDPRSSASHPLVVEIVTSGTLKRLLDIFEPLSLPFTPHQSTPSPTDYSVQGQHPDAVHQFIIHLIIIVLKRWPKQTRSRSNLTPFQPLPNYDAMTVTLNLTRDYLRRICQTSKLVTPVFEEFEIFGVLGSILLAAPHVDEAYSLLCELPILQAAMIFFETFAERGCSFDFLNDLERLFKPSNSVDAALPDRIAVVRGMILEEGWADKTEQILPDVHLPWTKHRLLSIKYLFEALIANL
ncbi:hypothetical protein BLNAU_21852 [Blattamonas nauphoetae]|uniref:Uncharacterized protein n=1 Tax=Blattamonas nauphoetae TaxID=2049346 RepID=A0ABQ9WXU5_9EUKA|nr:hypothetical protein BLNAU_21852 [Blattamonas nauphoetae]